VTLERYSGKARRRESKDFIRAHRDVLVGMDFFATEVLTLKGLTTYYMLFVRRWQGHQERVAGCTPRAGAAIALLSRSFFLTPLERAEEL
jgi:hypothetical protein